MINAALLTGLTGCTLLAASQAQTEDHSRDRFRLNLGSSINDFDSEIRVDHKGLPLALPIDLEDDLNFDEEVDINWLSGYWRYSARHRISFEYLPIGRKSNSYVGTDIEFEDDIIKAGAYVKSEFDTDIYDLNYIYSFYQTDSIELGVSAGLYWMDVEIDLSAVGNIQRRTIDGDGDIEFQDDYQESERAHAPLPLFGLSAQYQINPHWEIEARARYLDVEIGDYSGTFVSINASTSYFITEHLGFGLSVGSFDMDVKGEGSDFRGRFQWQYSGAQAYLAMRY